MEKTKEFNVKMRKCWKCVRILRGPGTIPACPWNRSGVSMELFRGFHETFPGCPWNFRVFHINVLEFPWKVSDYPWKVVRILRGFSMEFGKSPRKGYSRAIRHVQVQWDQ